MSTFNVYSLFHLFESEITQYYIWLLIYSCNTIYLVASLVGILDDDSLKLYTLIWKRTMACQMEASRTEMVGYARAWFFHVVYFILHDDNCCELWVHNVTLVKETLISLTCMRNLQQPASAAIWGYMLQFFKGICFISDFL